MDSYRSESSVSRKPPIDWEHPPGTVVDSVVTSMKRTGRWVCDGKSLRLLNKYWCLEVDKHVTSIAPRGSRDFTEDDVRSLLKFSRLASLDIAQFCRAKRFSDEPDRSAIGILHRLPHLSELIVDKRALFAIENNAINGLNVKSLSVHSSQPIDLNDLRTLSDLPIEHVRALSFEDGSIHRLGEIFPSLKTLAVLYDFLDEKDVQFVAALERLELVYRSEQLWTLRGLTSLVRLRVACFPTDDVEPLARLPKLRSLDLCFGSDDIFNGAFWILMQQLTSLVLNTDRRYTILPAKFWETATGLIELNLEGLGFGFDVFLLHDYKRLTRLTLRRCVVNRGCLRVERLTSLRSLSLNIIRGNYMRGLVPTPLKKLKEIQCYCYSSFQTTDYLRAIRSIISLEMINLVLYERLTKIDAALEDAFRSMPNLSRLVIDGGVQSATFQRLSDLKEALAHVDVEINAMCYGQSRPKGHQ